MIQINTLEDYFSLFETPGWDKKQSANCITYCPSPEVGKGIVKIYGDIDTFLYMKMDFCYTTDTVFLYAVEEPYIEISNNMEDTVLNNADHKELISQRGPNSHVNSGTLKAVQYFPAGTRFWKEALMIREQFIREEMPEFLKDDMFRMVSTLHPGEIADPRLAVLFKQMNAFPLDTDYGKTYLLGKVYEALALLRDKANQVQWYKAALSSAEIERLKKSIFFMKKNYNQPLSTEDLSKRFELNRNKLQVGFHALTGYSVHECLLNIRVQEATLILSVSDKTVPEIAAAVGFNSAKSLYDAFVKFLGIPPDQFRKAICK